MSFQVEQDAGHVESDLSSPVVSYGPENFRVSGWVLINFSLCMIDARQAHLFWNDSIELVSGEVYGADAERTRIFRRGLRGRGRAFQGQAVLQRMPGYPQPAFGQAALARRTAEVDHVYVLVEALHGIVDVLDHYGVGRDDFLGVWQSEFRARVEYLYFEAGFLQNLALDGLNRIFVGLDVSAGREPGFHLGMPVKGNAPAMDYESGGGEVADKRRFSIHWILGLTPHPNPLPEGEGTFC